MYIRLSLFLITFLFQVMLAHAQNSDSLRVIMQSEKSYKERVTAYLSYVELIRIKDFDETVRIGNEGLLLAQKNGDSVSVAELKRYIGEANYFKGNYNIAAQYFYQAISIFENAKEKTKLAVAYNALAKLYRKTRELKRSLENYDKAMEIYRSINDSGGISSIYNESGVVFEYSGDYEKAIERYRASLEMDRRRNDPAGMAYAMSNIAGVYTIQKKFREAEDYMKQVLNVRKELRDTFALALSYSDLGSLNFNSGNYEKASDYLDTSNRIADKMHFPELKKNNFDLLAQVAEKQGNFKLALDYYQQKSIIQDSIFSIEKTKQIEELNTKYGTEKNKRLIEEQQNKIEMQNLMIASAIGLVILAGLLGYTQVRRYKWKQEAKMQLEVLKQQELATKAVLEAEEAERQRIAKDLHDGVGQMMSAAKMNLSAYEGEANFKTEEERVAFDRIIQLVDESCKEVRSVSHNMMPNALLKNSLASAIREFIDKLDHKTLKVHLLTDGLDERLDSNVETVLYRVIQECVNNVIKHSGANTLDISLIREKDEITATVEDNGKGFELRDKEKIEGIGLKNIRTRVEYLKGTVDFDSFPGKGTLIAIHIPLHPRQ